MRHGLFYNEYSFGVYSFTPKGQVFFRKQYKRLRILLNCFCSKTPSLFPVSRGFE